jgi:superoxide dismutase, Fe-Mn family
MDKKSSPSDRWDLTRREFIALSGLTGVALLSGGDGYVFAQGASPGAAYAVKDYGRLLGMEGFSEGLLRNHFALYQGYVSNTNKLIETLFVLAKEGRTGLPEYAELKRRFGWEFNGMRLHEFYFENLGGKGRGEPESGLSRKMAEEFGDVSSWERDFKGVGMIRGVGWAVLYYDRRTGRLMNAWIGEHDGGHPAGCAPLLVFDAFEHAFLIDHGLRRADYVEVFFRNIDWKAVEARFSSG